MSRIEPMATPEHLRILAADLSLRCPGFAILRLEKETITVERLCHLCSKTGISHGETLAAIYQLLME